MRFNVLEAGKEQEIKILIDQARESRFSGRSEEANSLAEEARKLASKELIDLE